jgi:uncharacterized YigZ family protein
MDDSFLTIAAPSEGMYKDKGSKFLAFAYPVNDETEIKARVEALRKKYFDARHHCYAWRLGVGGEHWRANDDGEPSNSAGKPILGQITAAGLTNVLVVVVRYFGGILLGVGGLMQAYKQASADALAHAQTVTGVLTDVISLSCAYPDLTAALKTIRDADGEIIEQQFDMQCVIKVRIRTSRSAAFLKNAKEKGWEGIVN